MTVERSNSLGGRTFFIYCHKLNTLVCTQSLRAKKRPYLVSLTAPHVLAIIALGLCVSGANGVAPVSTSKLQEEVKERLRLLLSELEVVENFRPVWLTNPETGKKMELDFWLPSAKIGIEVQGRQHYEFNPFFHGTRDNFEAQLRRDEVKKSLCAQLGVHLYEINNFRDINRFIKEADELGQAVARRLHKKQTALKSLAYYAAMLHNENRKEHPVPSKVASIVAKMARISEKYKIPLRRIKPNFNLSKIQMSYLGKPIVEIRLLDKDGQVKVGAKAAILSVNGNIAKLRWIRKGTNKHIEMDFDLTTGLQVEEADWKWRIKLETLPKEE